MRIGKRSARYAVVCAVVAASSLTLAPYALAWYPGGFTRVGDAPCGSSEGLGTAVPLTSIGEPLLGHEGPWSPAEVIYDSPTNQTTQSVQRRGVAVRSTDVRCVDGTRYVDYRYSVYERRTLTTLYSKAGGSKRVITVPNNPRTSAWVAE